MSAVPAAWIDAPRPPRDRIGVATRHDLGFARVVLAGLARERRWIRIDDLQGLVSGCAADAARRERLLLACCSREVAAAADACAKAGGRGLVVVPPGRMNWFAPAMGARLLRRLGERDREASLLVVGTALVVPGALQADTDRRIGQESARRLLERCNEELGAEFDLAQFRHETVLDAQRQRVEARLVSRTAQDVRVLGRAFRFAAGEPIRLATSWRYSLQRFERLAAEAGWRHCQLWIDGEARYALHVLERDPASK